MRSVASGLRVFNGSVLGCEGGSDSNTPPLNRQLGGEDTVEIGLGVHWGQSQGEFLNRLDVLKAQALETGRSMVVPVGGALGVVTARGTSRANGAMYYAYSLTVAGIRFGLSRLLAPVEESPNVFVSVGSVHLMRAGGLFGVWGQVCDHVAAMGGTIVFNKLSRVDVCADLVDVDVSDFTLALLRQRNFVCRARKATWHSDGLLFTGMSIGEGGAIMARLYDKARETYHVTHDAEKASYLEEHRWGHKPESALRVEFQLRRDALKEFKVDSVEDYFRNRGPICSYLCADWLRVTEGAPDRENGNARRAVLATVWQAVQAAFESWVGVFSPGRRFRVRIGKPEALLKQAIGCLSSGLAFLTGGEDLDVRSYKTALHRLVAYELDSGSEDLVFRQYREKRLLVQGGG